MSHETSHSNRGAPEAAEPSAAVPAAELWSVSHLQALVDRRLRLLMPGPHKAPHVLHQAMSYALLAPGKRLRPLLTLQSSFHFGRRDLLAIDCACAIEMTHTASLIIDDLPAMDDSEMRRGQPTVHRRFGDDIAILSGIALLNLAYGVISSADGVPVHTRLHLVQLLSTAVGTDGLVGGQVLDLKLRAGPIEDQQIQKINDLKTSALFVAAAEAGARLADATEEGVAMARQFALELGAAFQIADDLLDLPAMQGTTGKDTGKDALKPTLVGSRGHAEAAAMVRAHMEAARTCLSTSSASPGPLGALLDYCSQQFRL